jgi:hypothetical protein
VRTEEASEEGLYYQGLLLQVYWNGFGAYRLH